MKLIIGFPYQKLPFNYESISREAFGNGVLFVVENFMNKKIKLNTFEDNLLPYLATD